MAQKKSTTKAAAPTARSKKIGAVVKKSPATKKAPAAKKVPVQKAAKKVQAAKKASAQKAPTKKAPGKKAPAKMAPAAQKAPAKKVAEVKKAAPDKKATGQKAPGQKALAAPSKVAAERPVAVKEEPKAPPKKATSKFNVGDKVVHPQHGAATIQRRVKETFDGQVRDYYVLDISTESLTVKIPVENVDSVVRSVISKTASKNVLGSLKSEPQEAGANWSRWYKVLTEKMYSGDIMQVAEVVRDLNHSQQTKGISPALKRMLSKARMTLISELAFSLEVDEEEATDRLDKALPKIENSLLPVP